MMPPQLLPLGDQAIVVQLGDDISESTFSRVQSVARVLGRGDLPGIREIVPAFASVTAYYDPLRVTWQEFHDAIAARLVEAVNDAPLPSRLVDVPVCYAGEFGPDLNDVAQHCGLAADEVVAIHCQVEYRVHMIGFAPGFPYLGGMSLRIAAPRRQTPRLVTPAGSVGIAGNQTGIYSLETPGGWQIIGRTPLKLFRPAMDPPTLLGAGDRLRFIAISVDEFHQVAREQT